MLGLTPCTVVKPIIQNTLLLVKDSSGIEFLVDTGASFSLLPLTFKNASFTKLSVPLIAANNSIVSTFGTIFLNLKFHFLSKMISWKFILANVNSPILGMDFLKYFDLLLDPLRGELFRRPLENQTMMFDSKDFRTTSQEDGNFKKYRTQSVLSSSVVKFRDSNQHAMMPSTLNLLPSVISNNFHSKDQSPVALGVVNDNNNNQTIPNKLSKTPHTLLLEQYPDITKDFDINKPILHNTVHYIDTSGPPLSSKPRRLNPNQLDFLGSHLKDLLKAGIIEPSSSPWSSPIHMVRKPDGSWRVTGDYRRLNTVSVPDSFPIPFLQDFTAKIAGSTVFSKLDLKKAYFQIPIHPKDVPKTTITTPLGAFQYLRLNFGLKNAPASWSRFIAEVLLELSSFLFFYLDDILVFSKDQDEHLVHLKLLFERLKKFGLLLNVEKCVFGVQQLDFLGHNVSKDGISPQMSKIKVIKEFPVPVNQKQLRNFIGLMSYYHKFIPRCAELLAPLNSLVLPGKASMKPVVFQPYHLEVFQKAKNGLINYTLLVHPRQESKISIATDASASIIAGVLQQWEDGVWKPLGFCSRKLTDTEMKYSIFSRELLAIHFAVKKFRFYVEYKPFTIFTDHQAICSAIKGTSENYLPREFRQIEYISAFTTDIQFVKGNLNIAADALTRICAISSVTVNLDDLARAQVNNEELEVLRQKPNFNFVLSKTINEVPIWVDESIGSSRPFVSEEFRFVIFQQLHELAHPGVKATQKLICSRFLWSNMRKDIKNWVKVCDQCQRNKVVRHTKGQLQSIVEPDCRFHKIHMDMVHLPYCQGYKYILSIIDRFSRWPEAIPLKSITTEEIIDAFVQTWISRYGVPQIITTDNAAQFCSSSWVDFISAFGIKHVRTSIQHPISQGIVERFHRSLKQSIKSIDSANWVKHLPLVLLGLRSAVKDKVGVSSAEILYGAPLRLPGDFFQDEEELNINVSTFILQLKQRLRRCKVYFTKDYNRPFYIPKDLYSTSHVFVRNDSHTFGLKPTYLGPFKVLIRNERYFVLEDFGDSGKVSIDRLKPAHFMEGN